MKDALTLIATTPQTEDGWAAYYERMESYLVLEDRPVLWTCPNCQCINATVIGEKACCVECGVRPMRPEPMTRPVI